MADTTPSTPGQTTLGALFRRAPGPPPQADGPGEPAARDAVAQARDFAIELLDAVRDSATALLDEQRTRVANEIAILGEVLHRSVQSLDRGDGALDRRGGANAARYADDAARQIGQFADRLRHRSLAEIESDIEGFAERWPVPFVASVIAIGLISGRLMTASAARPAGQHPAEQKTAPPHPASGGDGLVGGTARDDRALGEFASGNAKSSAE